MTQNEKRAERIAAKVQADVVAAIDKALAGAKHISAGPFLVAFESEMMASLYRAYERIEQLEND